MKDLEKIAKKIKELDVKYNNINNIEFEREMTKIMENLSLEELLEIEEKFLTN